MNAAVLQRCGILPSRLRAALNSALFAAILGGCGELSEQTAASIVSERDSAGVRMVDLSDVYADSTPSWGLGRQPNLTIGQTAGPPEYSLFDVVGATVLRDGSIAIADAGSSEVRVFDRSGTYLWTFGGRGEGPGEFTSMTFLGRVGADTLVTFDSRLRRATWFTAQGEVIRTQRLEPWVTEPANATLGILTAEVVGLVRGKLLVRSGYVRRTGEGEYRDSFALALVDRRGSLERIGEYPGPEYYIGRAPSGVSAILPVIFGRDTHIAAYADRLVVGSTDDFELEVYEGPALQMKVRASVDLAPVVEAETEAWRKGLRDSAGEIPGEFGELIRRLIPRSPARQTPPSFRQVLVDSDHSIWVAEPHRVPNGSSRWIVLAADGTPEASVEVSPDVTILEIGDNYVLGLRRDELEVEQVVMYGLERAH